MGFTISVIAFSKLFSAFGAMLAVLWGIKKALGIIQ